MNVLVFDTETVGCKTQTLLNVGYKICSVNPKTFDTKTLCQRDYIVRDVFANNLLMLNDMFVGADKYEKFKANLASGGTIERSIKQIFAQMQTDIIRHKVTAGYAYNADFDLDKFAKTSADYGIENPLEGLPVFDLWGMAFEFICKTQEYKDFCEENQMLTDSKRFFKTSVEGVIAFLNNSPNFAEEHTALSDVQWETKILQECLKRGANPFGTYGHGFIASGYVFTKTLVLPSGEKIPVSYKKMTKWNDDSEIIVFK